MKFIDEVATSKGKEPLKKGEGRKRWQREQKEGYCQRVSRHGALPATEENRGRSTLARTHLRNARRRAEAAMGREEEPEPGIGAKSYNKGTGKGEDPDVDTSADSSEESDAGDG